QQQSQPETCKLEIINQALRNLSKRADYHCDQTGNAYQPHMQIGFEVAVVSLIRPPPPFGPHDVQALSQPEALEPRPDQRAVLQLDHIRPHLGSVRQAQIPSESGDHLAVDIEERLQGAAK